MTIDEAKILLCQMYLPQFDEEEKQALTIAIQALEEIQQYRALEEKLNGISVEQVVDGFISTVEKETQEGYERGRILTNKEADEWNELQAIGTIEEFKDLKEKNTPKKGIPCTSSNNHEFVECPNCHKDMDLYYDYCQYCGQSVDWGKSKT